MADTYLHGAYGQHQATGSRVAAKSQNAIVYIGTAPVHTIEGGGANVNRPTLVENISDARKYFGYSDDFASYTLCEAMKVHFELNGVGPLVFINVLDPATHVSEEAVSKSLTPENGRIVIAGAESIVLDTVSVKAGSTTKVKGTDYSVRYDASKKTLTLSELSSGALGTATLTIGYKEIDPAAVDEDTVIGASDGMGLNTGIFAVRNVYQQTGYIPSFLLAPGFSSIPAVHSALVQNSQKINGHWDAYMLVDLPLTESGSNVTLTSAKTWKNANGYTKENETVYFPMAQGTDGRHYHLSVLAAANFQTLLAAQDGIPYKTASNTDCGVIENLYMGANSAGRVYDDEMINELLCKNGIASAAYVGGRWAIWGCHSADYSYEGGDQINVSETNRMMLYYISNDFQHRRTRDVDKPLTANDIQSIVAEEQTRLDALVKIGALTYGEVHMNAEADKRSDMMKGDYSFAFNVTTTPLAKSLTAIVNWTSDGFVTYFESFGD